jgi:hypothetical protein
MLSLAVGLTFPHSADSLALNLARSDATALGAARRFEPKPSGLAASDSDERSAPRKDTEPQLASALRGPFGLCGLNFRADAGLAFAGSPEGALALGGGPKTLRHSGESCDLLRIMQAVMRSTSGISDPQRRSASPVQYCCCSAV